MRISLVRVLLIIALLAFIYGDVSRVNASGEASAMPAEEWDESYVHVSQESSVDEDENVDLSEGNAGDNDEMAEDFENYMRESRVIELPPVVSHVIFPDSDSPAFPQLVAGVATDSLIAFKNTGAEAQHIIFLVTAMLQPARQYASVTQNFSVVRHARRVMRNETVSLQYSFTPHPMLNPGEYNLLMRVFYNSGTGGSPMSVTAFNQTVTVGEASGTDERMLLTYVTLLAIAFGIFYALANYYGLVKMISTYRSRQKRVQTEKEGHQKNHKQQSNAPDNGSEAATYDPDYVSPEHLRFREMLLKGKQGNQSNKRRK